MVLLLFKNPLLLKSYLSSSVHVAFALWAFSNVLALQQGISLSLSMHCALFGFCWAGYQYTNTFVPILYKKQAVSIGNIILFIVALALGFSGLMAQSYTFWWVFFGVGVLTLCYALPFGSNMGLRYVPMLKVFVVVLSWAVMALLPLISLPKQLFVWVVVKTVLWVLCIMLPFELRDLCKDALRLKTIPQLIGISGTKILGYLLLCEIAYLAYFTVQVRTLFWVEIIMLFLLGLSISVSPKRSENFTAFWVEGIPILWFLGSVFALIF